MTVVATIKFNFIPSVNALNNLNGHTGFSSTIYKSTISTDVTASITTSASLFSKQGAPKLVLSQLLPVKQLLPQDGHVHMAGPQHLCSQYIYSHQYPKRRQYQYCGWPPTDLKAPLSLSPGINSWAAENTFSDWVQLNKSVTI